MQVSFNQRDNLSSCLESRDYLVVDGVNVGSYVIHDILNEIRRPLLDIDEYYSSTFVELKKSSCQIGQGFRFMESKAISPALSNSDFVILPFFEIPVFDGVLFCMLQPKGVILENVTAPFVVVEIEGYSVDKRSFIPPSIGVYYSCLNNYIDGDFMGLYDLLFYMDLKGIPRDKCKFTFVNPFEDKLSLGPISPLERTILLRKNPTLKYDSESGDVVIDMETEFSRVLGMETKFGQGAWRDNVSDIEFMNGFSFDDQRVLNAVVSFDGIIS